MEATRVGDDEHGTRGVAWIVARSWIVVALGVGGCGSDGAAPAGEVVVPVDHADTVALVDTAEPEDLVEVPDATLVEDVTMADTSAPPDALGPLALPLESLCEPWAETSCRLTVGCRAVTSPGAVAACREHAARVCDVVRAEVGERVATGTVRYDADAAGVCLRLAALLDCAAPEVLAQQVPPACGEVFSGQLGAGADCEWVGECEAGLYCAVGESGGCPGTCRAAPQLGEVCDARFAPCGAGAWCELGVCVAAEVGLGEPCAISSQCSSTAFCDDEEVVPRCRTRRGPQGSCADDDACGAGLFCAILDFADVGSCAPQVAAGEACVVFLGGEQCAQGEVCDTELARCVPRPERAGDACVADWQPCGEQGLWCDAASETCRALPMLGEGCGAGGVGRCQAGYCSAEDGFAAGVCEAFRAPGEACDDARVCGGLDCVAGRCGLDPAGRCEAGGRRALSLGAGLRLFP